MKTMKHLNKSKKYFKLLFSFIIITIAFNVSNQSFAQCSHVTQDVNGKAVSVMVPCDFPLYKVTKDSNADQELYQIELRQWNSAHPMFAPVVWTSKSVIEIPAAQFKLFSEARQKEVMSLPDYYHVIK